MKIETKILLNKIVHFVLSCLNIFLGWSIGFYVAECITNYSEDSLFLLLFLIWLASTNLYVIALLCRKRICLMYMKNMLGDDLIVEVGVEILDDNKEN